MIFRLFDNLKSINLFLKAYKITYKQKLEQKNGFYNVMPLKSSKSPLKSPIVLRIVSSFSEDFGAKKLCHNF